MHPKWEYLVESIPVPNGQTIGIVRSNAAYVNPVQEYLNGRGEEGWELVEFYTRDGSQPRCDIYAPGVVFVFKRLKLGLP